MMGISVHVNGKTIYARTATRIDDGSPNRYHLDTGEVIEHEFDDGIIVLAKKLLDTIHEEVGELDG